MTPTKTKKGAIVVAEIRRSMAMANFGGVGAYTVYELAYVESASRDGLATKVRLAGSNYVRKVDAPIAKIWTIEDPIMQARAKVLADNVADCMGREWESPAAIKQSLYEMADKGLAA